MGLNAYSKIQRIYELQTDTNDKVPTTLIIKPPLSLYFDVENTCDAKSGKAIITIINMNSTDRSRVFKDGFNTALDPNRHIVLSCGYKNDELTMLPKIFQGNIRTCYSTRERTETHTVWDCYQYGNDQAQTKVSASMDASMPQKQIFEFLAAKFPNIGAPVIGMFASKIPSRGSAYFGNVCDLLLELTNHKFAIADGVPLILRDSEVIPGDVISINTSSGLLGSPRRTGSWVECDMLFEPRMRCGAKVILESSTNDVLNVGSLGKYAQSQGVLDGQYKIWSVKHRGVISEAECGECKTTVTLMAGQAFIPVTV